MKRLALLLVASVAHADPSPAELAGPPPANANKLATGVVWTIVAPGRGARARSTDWIVYYGGSRHESRETYYMAKVAQAGSVLSFDVAGMSVGETRRYWTPASGPTSSNVVDIELVAIIPKPASQQALFPPPVDARTAASGDRFVTVNAGKTQAHADLVDRVHFDAMALDPDVKHVDLGFSPGTKTLADVGVPAVVDAVRDMDPGEVRYVWTRRGRTPMFVRITLYSIEKRPQVPAPPDVAKPPPTAQTGPDVRYVVLATGTGEPIDVADTVTLDYTVWSPTGRTIESVTGATQPASDLEFREQLSEMRDGESRRIWMSPQVAGYYGENGRGAVVDVVVRALQRNIDLLPGGVRIAHDRHAVEVVRGTNRVRLPLRIARLTSAKLASGVVTFTGEDSNDLPVSEAVPLAQLDARLDDDEAKQAAGAGKLDAAIAAGERALARAPELPELYTALARTYLVAGKSREAAQTLGKLAVHNPVWVYWQVHERAELSALAGEPELASLRVKTPAAIDLDKQTVLVDRAGRFLAVELTEGSWGSGDDETRIEIIDAATTQIVATIPRVAWSFMTQPMTAAITADVTRRKREVAGWLAELGFAAPKDLERGSLQSGTVTFAKAKLAVPADPHTQAAYWIPGLREIVYVSRRPGHECCESTDPVWVTVTK